jgi:anoctamin-10
LRCLANWENHAHQSTHDASLTIKTFALSSIVAYLGLSLSAFVYAPFGEYLMTAAQTFMLKEIKRDEVKAEATTGGVSGTLDTSRLQNQMFAYMVTNQISDTFTEVGLPFILRGFSDVKSGKGLHLRNSEADEKDGDLALIQDIQYQASLPEYSLFVDYSEMVTQVSHIRDQAMYCS